MTEIREIVEWIIFADTSSYGKLENLKQDAEAQINALIKQAKIDTFKECEEIAFEIYRTNKNKFGALLAKNHIKSKRLEFDQLKDDE